jgi:UDP-N-acetylglucosamine acyltransferase
MSTRVHPTAVIESGAELDDDVSVGPFCVISSQTKIGKGSKLHSHVVFDGRVECGPENEFFPFCVIGGPPQDLGYKGEDTRVVIGARNLFRESCTIHRGTPKDQTQTIVGDDNFIMGFCHIAHDCVLGNKIIMANQTAMAGHVRIGNYANIGGQTGITQFVRIGEYSFIGAGTVMRRDLPPYMCAKEFSQVSGPNLVGLKRGGLGEEETRMAREIYKILYLGTQTTEKSMAEIESRYKGHPFVDHFVQFCRETRIGIQR